MKMKLKITKIIVGENSSASISPVDNILLFEHCYGTEFGSPPINSCSLEIYATRIKPLLIAHGITEFIVTTDTTTL